jgi:hypothetical protein
MNEEEKYRSSALQFNEVIENYQKYLLPQLDKSPAHSTSSNWSSGGRSSSKAIRYGS